MLYPRVIEQNCYAKKIKTTRYHKHNYPTAGLITVLATAAGLLTAYAENIVVKNMFGDERTIYDSDGDGWDDLWCAIFSDIEHRNQTVDTDGDGTSDYDEMLLWRDPMVEGPPPRKLTPEEIAEGEEAARRAKAAADAATRARATLRKAELAPFIPRELVVGEEVRTVTRPKAESVRAAAREHLAERQRLAPQPLDARRRLAARFGVAERETLQSGATAKLTGEFGGRPVAVQSDNHFAADLNGVAQLWPAGLNTVTPPATNPPLPPLWVTGGSGLDLTGAGTRLALFEVDAVYDTTYSQHEDLGSSAVNLPENRKLWQVDSSSPSNFHATGVAGVLVGEGSRDLSSWLTLTVRNTPSQTLVAGVPVGDAARGMSYEAQLSAWDTDDSDVELTTAFAIHNTNLSNHSYGLTAGWQLREAPLLHRWNGIVGTALTARIRTSGLGCIFRRYLNH